MGDLLKVVNCRKKIELAFKVAVRGRSVDTVEK